jgi:aspartate/methionine/tyrosine aminotransferase
VKLPDFRLEVFFSRWEFDVRFNLSASAAQCWRLDELLALASDEDRERFARLPLNYIPPPGTPELREQIAATYEAIAPDQVLSFCGAEEGLFCAMHALLQAGDHAVVTTPNFQSTEELPLQICGQVSAWPLRAENNWEPDLDELRAALRPNTRLLAVNFPNNPTGKVPARATWQALIALAREKGLWLLSDEVFRGLEAGEPLPQAADLYERALSLNVTSKAYGLAGLRLGWIACQDREVIHKLERVKHYLTICTPAPSDALACIALKARERLLGRNRSIVQSNRTLLLQFFARHADRFAWSPGEGGCIGFPRYLGGEGAETWCQTMVEKHGLLLLPGSLFRSRLGESDSDSDSHNVQGNHFRIGFGQSDFPQALRELENVLL